MRDKTVSYSTAITIVMAVDELCSRRQTSKQGGLDDAPDLLVQANKWLDRHRLKPLALLAGSKTNYGALETGGLTGTLPSTLLVASGGYTNLPDDMSEKFRDHILAQPWRHPEAVLLFICADGDIAQIFRPEFPISW
jgi:hypothetical protein